MPWDKRKRTTKRYYSRAWKKDGLVVRLYLGSEDDPLTRLLAQLDDLERAECRSQRDALHREQALWGEIENLEGQIAQHVDLLVRAGMLSEGYRTKQHGGWVRLPKAMMRESNTTSVSGSLPSQDALADLVQRAEARDRDALHQLRQVLQRHPEIWQEVSDVSAQVEERLIRFLAGDGLLGAECLSLRLEHQRALLSRGKDSPMERLLVNLVARLWLEVEAIEMARLQPSSIKSHTRFWEERARQTQRRYLRAMRTLAQIRQILPGESTPTSPETG